MTPAFASSAVLWPQRQQRQQQQQAAAAYRCKCALSIHTSFTWRERARERARERERERRDESRDTLRATNTCAAVAVDYCTLRFRQMFSSRHLDVVLLRRRRRLDDVRNQYPVCVHIMLSDPCNLYRDEFAGYEDNLSRRRRRRRHRRLRRRRCTNNNFDARFLTPMQHFTITPSSASPSTF